MKQRHPFRFLRSFHLSWPQFYERTIKQGQKTGSLDKTDKQKRNVFLSNASILVYVKIISWLQGKPDQGDVRRSRCSAFLSFKQEIINKAYIYIYEWLLLNASFNPFYKVLHTVPFLHQHWSNNHTNACTPPLLAGTHWDFVATGRRPGGTAASITNRRGILQPRASQRCEPVAPNCAYTMQISERLKQQFPH